MKTYTLFCSLAVALLVGVVYAEKAAVKSGPQVDAEVPGPFLPLNVTGAKAGEKFCLYCTNGNNPVAMVFAREVTPAVTTLIKKIDETTVANKDCKMGSFVVFCSDEEGLDKKLKDMADDQKLSKIVLSIDNPTGPKGYEVAKEADVTVVLYNKRTVKANYAFKKGQLNDKAIEKIVADVSKITPSK
jgi:hypothetical protein